MTTEIMAESYEGASEDAFQKILARNAGSKGL